MQISPYLVKWDVVAKKAETGTLEEDLDEIGEGEDWADNQCDWLNDSFMHCCQVGEALDLLVPKLDDDLRKQCERSLSLIFNECSAMPKELGDALDPEYFVGSISPKTINTILEHFTTIDKNDLLLQYERHISEALRNTIGDSKENFVRYLEQWESLFIEAKNRNMGLLVHVG